MSLYVIGFGPGNFEGMTGEAVSALEKCDLIIGYHVYTDLLKPCFPDKEFYTTGMTAEVERCRYALKCAKEGRQVAVVCSGDSGVYGMAGLLLQLGENSDANIQVIPGVTAATSGAAVLGAPLSHDFCVISLSDLLTPLTKIKERIRYAAMADLVICLYNPSSRKRESYLKMACEIILEYQKPETVCGYVKNIGREGETASVLTLLELKDTKTDMFTTVYIGNSSTIELAGKMITPRGYHDV